MLYRPPRRQEPANPLQASRLPGGLPSRGLGPLTEPAPAPAGASVASGLGLQPMSQLGNAAVDMTAALGVGGGNAGDADMDVDADTDDGGAAARDNVGPVAPGLSSKDLEDLCQVRFVNGMLSLHSASCLLNARLHWLLCFLQPPSGAETDECLGTRSRMAPSECSQTAI